MVRCNILNNEPEGGLVMLMFLATLSVSVAASFLVEAVDIECIETAKRRMSLHLSQKASYPDGAVAGALR